MAHRTSFNIFNEISKEKQYEILFFGTPTQKVQQFNNYLKILKIIILKILIKKYLKECFQIQVIF